MVLRPFSESRCCNPSPPTDMLFSCVFPQIQCILRSFTKEGSSRTGRDFACYTVQYSRKVKTYIHTSSAPPTIGSQTQRGTCRNCALRCLDESLFSKSRAIQIMPNCVQDLQIKAFPAQISLANTGQMVRKCTSLP